MSEALGATVSLKRAIVIVISGLFAASVTPATVGDEVVRVQLLRRHNLSIGDASAAVISERILDALFLGMAAPIGFILFQRHVESSVGLTALFFSSAILFFVIFFIMLYAIANPRKL